MNLTSFEIAHARLFHDEVSALENRRATPGGVLFIGSSSIRMWSTLEEDFPGMPITNHGFGGSHLSDSVYHFERLVPAAAPSTVVLYAGDNDIGAGKPATRVVEHFRDFHQQLQSALPQARLLFLSIKPSLARWPLIAEIRSCNAEIHELCQEQELCQFINLEPSMLNSQGLPRPELFVEDGNHLTREGYRVWAQCLRPYLTESSLTTSSLKVFSQI